VAGVALTALPVRIRDGGTASDTLEVQYGESLSGVPVTQIVADQTTAYADRFTVLSVAGFQVGDLIVANVANGAPSGICTLAEVSDVGTATDPDPARRQTIGHQPGGFRYNVLAAPGGTGWNAVAGVAYNPASTPRTPLLANLGSFRSRRFTTAATTATAALTIAELPGFASNVLVDDIVFLKAQYGVAIANCNPTAVDPPPQICSQVATWETGTSFTVDNTNSTRVIAIRVGVVARSPLYEKDVPPGVSATLSLLPSTTGAVSTVADPAAGQCATDATTLEVKCTVPDTHYRYRAFSTVVPLKSVIWGN
jgi:type IV pilus assembly protein PilW